MCKKDYSLWISHVGIDVGKAFSRSRVHFSKNWIHISREIPQFTFHIPLIENCTWTSLTSHFSNHISYYIMYIFCFISCILLFMICEMGNGKWDSHFTFLRCQMWFVKQTWNVISFFRKMDSCFLSPVPNSASSLWLPLFFCGNNQEFSPCEVVAAVLSYRFILTCDGI